MKCSDLQSNLALYSASDAEGETLKNHLESCPLCRVQYDEFQALRNGLKKLRRPEISSEFRDSIKQNLRLEIQHSQTAWLPVSLNIREWLAMRFMPYTVGVCASVMVSLTFLTVMFSGMHQPVNSSGSRIDTSVMLASNRNPFDTNINDNITAAAYAQTRLGFGGESPSINPQGTLIALTKSLVRGGMKDDEVVVVADVFGNGLAQIAQVVEPSRNRRAVGELEKALHADLSYAPFVPASIEKRPESVRVVLKFQSVNVSTNQKHPTQKPARQ